MFSTDFNSKYFKCKDLYLIKKAGKNPTFYINLFKFN
jgi:hypothetical protein